MNNLNRDLALYKNHLKNNCPNHHKLFVRREKSDPESCRSEAAAFSVLQANCIKVSIHEEIGRGGADFLCEKDGTSFLVEVTCIEKESVSKKSGLTNNPLLGGSSFSLVTSKLQGKAKKKIRQLVDTTFPRVLIVTCEHWGSDLFLDRNAASCLLTGDPKIRLELNRPNDKLTEVTHFENSVFFCFDSKKQNIKPQCRSISAILLMQIYKNEYRNIGILHPDPVVKFSSLLFPSAQFLEIANWPLKPNESGFFPMPKVIENSVK